MSRDTGSRGFYLYLIAQTFRSATSHVLLDGRLMADEGGECKGRKFADIDINDSNAIIDVMASITIRNLPEATKKRLRIRAAERGHSMEEEARGLIERGLAPVSKPSDDGKWVDDMLARMRAIDGGQGVDLVIPEYEAAYEPIDFSKHEFDE